MDDKSVVLMRHPELDKELADRDATEVQFGAFRDCWSKLGWTLVEDPTKNEVVAVVPEGQTDGATSFPVLDEPSKKGR